jgi:hypothetical protein
VSSTDPASDARRTAQTLKHDPQGRVDVQQALLGGATYRSLGEQRLSPAEERFEKGRRTVGLFLAPLVTLVFPCLSIAWARMKAPMLPTALGMLVVIANLIQARGLGGPNTSSASGADA